jgi:murein DD-endopeptidase MepM/ murein hydrolase activator NlpD
MSGEPLHFHRTSTGDWHAIGAVSPDAKGEATATVLVMRSSGKTDSLSSSERIPVPAPSPAAKHPLAVSSRFTKPLDAETEKRIERENATARELGERSHDTPTLWTAPFIHPRESVITSPFGSGRMFNGTLTSRHLGVDFRGKTGDPIVAANRGVVALVGNFFLAGNVIYIDHGRGIVTAYFHMSKTLVAAGDTVERGQKIGLVGSTGRVTGPHLHWSARYGAITVNPLDLFSLGSGW